MLVSFSAILGRRVAVGLALATAGCLAAIALAPAAAQADQVIPDDLIVNGGTSSACIGSDCVDGEVFGSDTLRLKENNLRIHFEDTSTSSFADRDWRLVANEQGGTGEYFSIEDATSNTSPFSVEGGTGDVGLGVLDPALRLHLFDGNTPGMRLQQSGGGFGDYTWDVAGNESNFFIRDTTGGNQLPFRIFPGAPSNSIDIASTGNVGMGTTAPGQDLEIADGDSPTMRLNQTGADARLWDLVGDDGSFALADATASTTPLSVGAGAPDSSLSITSAGDVGIGKATPGSSLDVVGDTATSGDLAVGGNTATAGNLSIGGNATSEGDLDVAGTLTAGKFSPESFDVGNQVSAGSLDVSGNGTFGGSLNVLGELVAPKGISIGSDSPATPLEIEQAGPALIALTDTTKETTWNAGVSGRNFILDNPAKKGKELVLTPKGKLKLAGKLKQGRKKKGGKKKKRAAIARNRIADQRVIRELQAEVATLRTELNVLRERVGSD